MGQKPILFPSRKVLHLDVARRPLPCGLDGSWEKISTELNFSTPKETEYGTFYKSFLGFQRCSIDWACQNSTGRLATMRTDYCFYNLTSLGNRGPYALLKKEVRDLAPHQGYVF